MSKKIEGEKENLVEATKSKELKMAAENVDASLTPLEIEMINAESIDEVEAAESIAYEQNKRKSEMSLDQAMNMVNPQVPSRFLAERPSWGTVEGVTEIHTRPAYIIILGRTHSGAEKKQAGITGLFGFAKTVRDVMNAYRRGCPFAAKTLIDLEQDLTHVDALFKIKDGELRKLVQGLTRMNLKPFVAKRAAQVEVTFANPYAYHVMDLLLRFDDMVRVILPYQQAKFIDYAVYDNHVKELGRHLRRLCSSCDRYFFVGDEAVRKQDDVY